MDTSTLIGAIDKAGRRKVQRRMYTLEDKQRVIAEANARGASVAEVARGHGINANLVFNWRRQDQQGVLEAHTRRVKLLPVQISGAVVPDVSLEPRQSVALEDGRIEIVLVNDIRVTIVGRVSGERVEHVLAILRRSA